MSKSEWINAAQSIEVSDMGEDILWRYDQFASNVNNSETSKYLNVYKPVGTLYKYISFPFTPLVA